MKGYAMLKIGESGWIEKERPVCGPLDAICRPLAVAICTSDVHTLWEGAIGERHNMILGHECCAEVVEVGELVKDFKPGDRVLVPAITPDWNSLEAQAGYSMHSGGMLAGWKFSIFAWDELNALSKESLEAARHRLMDILCNYQGFKKCALPPE